MTRVDRDLWKATEVLSDEAMSVFQEACHLFPDNKPRDLWPDEVERLRDFVGDVIRQAEAILERLT